MSFPAVAEENDTSNKHIPNTSNNTLKENKKKTNRLTKTRLTEDAAVEKFDARYVQLFLGQNYVIWDKKEKCPKDLNGLRNYYNNFFVKQTETKYGRTQTVEALAIDVWYEQSANRYERCDFLPGRSVVPDGIYNLWNGWAVSPNPGSCDKFLAHVLENICDRDQKLFDYLMDWVADIFQNSDRKNGIQVTLYSREQGTGKSFFWETISRLLEGYAITLSSSDGLVGGFNAHLANKMLVVLEEAFWAGDKKAEIAVKNLDTSGNQSITYKGKDTVQVKSYVRLGYSSNESWSNHVGETDRRNFVIGVKAFHQNDRKYFQAIQEELNSGGYEALMDWILERKISADWSEIPATPEKLQNLLRSLSPVKQWIYHNLCQDEGAVKSIFKVARMPENSISTVELFRQYSEFYKTSSSVKLSFHNFSIEFKSLGYKQGLVDSGAETLIRGYILPDLDTARRKFDQHIGMDIDWAGMDSANSADEISDYEKSLLEELEKGKRNEQ